MNIQSASQRTIIMDLLKNKFNGLSLWNKIEGDIALLCSEIPEIIDEERKKSFIKILRKIKRDLIEKGIDKDELDFLDEEIDRNNLTKQITLHEEKDDQVSLELIKQYAVTGASTEGIVGIHLSLNYEQLKKLTNGVYRETGLIKFYISKEKTIYGQINAEVYENPQDLPIATLAKQIKKDDDGEHPVKIFLFGEKVNSLTWAKIKEIKQPFRIYRFISDKHQELYLLSTEELEIGDYRITGVITEVDDLKALTDSAKLTTKLHYMFVREVKNRIIRFKDHDDFLDRLNNLVVTKDNLFDFPFTLEIKKKLHILHHPVWFKWLIWSWFLHKKKGLFNEYPLHIMMIGPKGSGKSLLMNSLHARSKESKDLFSGSSSTLKNLIPSFRYSPAKLGYLAESNRFAFCDEFLRCLIRVKSDDKNNRDESVAMMNDLLEHQKREAGSGVSKVNVNMTARILAGTNPIKEIHNVVDLLKKMDESFLSRWLIYYQTDYHINMIKRSREDQLKTLNYEMSTNDWISIVDYLQTFDAKYSKKKLEVIYDKPTPILTGDLKSHYETRHIHHMNCLIDGIIKTRCLFEKDMDFKAKPEDYEMLELIWTSIIKSWVDVKRIKDLPIEQRSNYVPENAQYLYSKIVESKRILFRIEIEEIALKEMTKNEYFESVTILRDNGLVYEDDGTIKPYYMKDNEPGQTRL